MNASLIIVCDELYRIVKSAPADLRLYFNFTSSRCDVIHHADDSTILQSFTLDRWTEKPTAILAQLRAYLATLSEPQMATDAGGRWVAKDQAV